MERIIAYARSEKLKTIFGIVLHENQGMLKLSRKLEPQHHRHSLDALVERHQLYSASKT